MESDKKSLENNLYLLLLFIFTIHSLLFNFSDRISSIFMYSGLILCVILINILCNKKVSKVDIRVLLLNVILILPIFLYGYKNGVMGPNAESVRYGLFFLIFYIWSKRNIDELKKFHFVLILFGLLCCLLQLKNGVVRPSGFLESPTIFSCIIVISITYLLFEKKFSLVNIFLIIIGIFEIILSGSSSSLLVVLGLIIYKIIINIVVSGKEKKSNHLSKSKTGIVKTFIFITAIICVFALFNNVEFFLSIIKRGNRDSSTATRLNIISTFINQITNNVKTFMIGTGGGYTRDYIINYINSSKHMPLHQDILMLFCEYGFIGLIYIYYFFLKKIKINYIMIVVLFLLSFHNIILAPYVICLFIITNNALNKQYEETKILL